MVGMAGSAWSSAVSTTGSSSARVGVWRSRLAQVVLGQRRCRLGLGRRPGRWLGSGQVDWVADQDRPGAREDLPSVGSPGCSEVHPPGAGCAVCHLHHCCSEPAQDRALPRRWTRHRIRHKAQRERTGVLAQIRGGDYVAWSLWAASGRVAWSLRAFPAGLVLELAAGVRPQPAVSAARSRLATL
jgi:hypothetical protein